MVTRSDTDLALHRLANYVETQLSNLLRDLLAESRTDHARDLVWSGLGFVENLREVVDGKRGDE